MLNNTPTVISFVVSDQGYQLNFICTDNSGNLVNITGGSITLNAQLESDPAVQVSGAMGITSGPAGTCYYLLTGTDFQVYGTYNAQIVVSLSSGTEVMTFNGITINANFRVPQ